jgi:thiaminase/transcriptional activator TenA
MTPTDLLTGHRELWQEATHHPFLDGVRDGRLPGSAFDRWLVQDYHFVEALVRTQARILAGAPRKDLEVLSAGVKAGVDELAWFAQTARTRGVTLQTPVHLTCRAYVNFLYALTYDRYVVQITAVWAIERAYLDAWTTARGGEDTYGEFVEHWTNPAFQAYVTDLEGAAHHALVAATSLENQAAAEAFRSVARYEAAFWEIGAAK